MSREEARPWPTTSDQIDRRPSVDGQRDRWRAAVTDADERLGRRDPPPAREALDRELREIKDNVLRMGAWSRSRSGRRARGPRRSHDAEAAPAVIRGDGRINEMQRKLTTHDLDRRSRPRRPVARDLRFLLALDHVTYELERMGDHAGVRRQAGPQARAAAAAEQLRRPARDGRAGRAAGPRHPAGAGRHRRDRPPATVAARDDEIDDLYHRIFDEVLEPDARRPGQRRSRAPGSCSRPTTSSGSATG